MLIRLHVSVCAFPAACPTTRAVQRSKTRIKHLGTRLPASSTINEWTVLRTGKGVGYFTGHVRNTRLPCNKPINPLPVQVSAADGSQRVATAASKQTNTAPKKCHGKYKHADTHIRIQTCGYTTDKQKPHHTANLNALPYFPPPLSPSQAKSFSSRSNDKTSGTAHI